MKMLKELHTFFFTFGIGKLFKMSVCMCEFYKLQLTRNEDD